MKLLLIIALLCINNFSSPVKGIKSNGATKKEAKASFQMAPSILIVTTY